MQITFTSDRATQTGNFYIKDLQEQGFTSNFKPNGWNHYVVLEELFDLLE